MKVAVGEPFRSRNAVPEITAELAPALVTPTEIRPTKSLTGFPDTSRTEISGWVLKAARFTAPVAEVVRAS